MSINPIMAEDQISGELVPLPQPGEIFVLKRDHIYFQSGSRKNVCKAMGCFLLSSARLVFVAVDQKNKKDFGAFEMPLGDILEQVFQQPIFGCNYLELKMVSKTPEVTGDAEFPVYLYFYEGGAGSFLNCFYRFFAAIEEERSRRPRAGQAGGGAQNLAGVARSVMNNRSAFADRTDPTTFYLQQPQVAGGSGGGAAGSEGGGVNGGVGNGTANGNGVPHAPAGNLNEVAGHGYVLGGSERGAAAPAGAPGGASAGQGTSGGAFGGPGYRLGGGGDGLGR